MNFEFFCFALVLVTVGCASSERATDDGTRREPVGDVPRRAAAAGPSEPAGAIANRSDVPASNAPPQDAGAAVEPAFNPALVELEAQHCPIPASECPRLCASVAGWRLDEANRCVSPVVVGCWPRHGWMNSDLACFQRADGVVVETSSSFGSKLGPGWTGCRVGATEALFAKAPRCPEESSPSP